MANRTEGSRALASNVVLAVQRPGNSVIVYKCTIGGFPDQVDDARARTLRARSLM